VSTQVPSRSTSYGQTRPASPVDRLGVWLSARAVHRHAAFDGARVADLGCGFHAKLARSVLPRVADLLLVDVALAPDLRDHAKVTAVEGPLPDALAGQPDGSRDIVLCLSVLEHLTEPQRTLREIRRLLAPGGVALLNVPNWRGKVALELAAFRLGVSPAEEMDDHKMYYDPRDLWPLLVAAGFRPSGLRVHRHKLGLNTFAVCRAGER
jgi:2-polyprenyl-3-methyl-5-hydroxy-6-metoxy-1,4-benzoquinol methylase